MDVREIPETDEEGHKFLAGLESVLLEAIVTIASYLQIGRLVSSRTSVLNSLTNILEGKAGRSR
jgi:hypothetical protein